MLGEKNPTKDFPFCFCLITCQYRVPTKVGVVKDSKEFFPPKQKILDETLTVTYSVYEFMGITIQTVFVFVFVFI